MKEVHRKITFIILFYYALCICAELILKATTSLCDQVTILEIFIGPIITLVSAGLIWLGVAKLFHLK